MNKKGQGASHFFEYMVVVILLLAVFGAIIYIFVTKVLP